MLKTKSILETREVEDGLRISVMSRHTLNDGITPHPQITFGSYDLWARCLAPPQKLVGDYYKRGLTWPKFEERYLDYIQQPVIQSMVRFIAEISLEKTITLLCIENIPDYCHRRLLAEECQKYQPELNM